MTSSFFADIALWRSPLQCVEMGFMKTFLGKQTKHQRSNLNLSLPNSGSFSWTFILFCFLALVEINKKNTNMKLVIKNYENMITMTSDFTFALIFCFPRNAWVKIHFNVIYGTPLVGVLLQMVLPWTFITLDLACSWGSL